MSSPHGLAKPLQVLPQRGEEPLLWRDAGLDSQDILAGVGVGLVGRVRQAGQVGVGCVSLPLGQQLAGCLGLHVGIAQHLSQVVVQPARQPLPFLQPGQHPLLPEQLGLCLFADR